MSGHMEVRGLEHIGLAARDTIALARWYCDLFGAEVVSRSSDTPPIQFLALNSGSLIELVPAGDAPAGCDHVHLAFGVDDLPAAVDRLEAAGGRLERPVFTAYDGSPVAFFRDPEGNLLQLVERHSSLAPKAP